MRNFCNPKSTVTIDIVDINTGEVYETFAEIWGGEVKRIIEAISKKYKVVNVERYRSDWKTVWVEA